MTVVLFETLWHSLADGWSTASRAYARAMHDAGLTVQLHSWLANVEDKADPRVIEEVGHLLNRERPRDLYVFSCTLSGEWGTSYTLRPLTKARRPRAFYTMFERRQVDPATVEWLNQLEAVWVPCSANAEVLAAAGTKNVSWIPFPYFDEDPHLALPPPKSDPDTFLWVGRWEPRKAPHNLIRAFLRAFRPGEAKLILKVGPVPWKGEYASPEDVLAEETRAGRWSLGEASKDIEIVRGRLSPEEMLALHARADVYVSASRGEGLDLPAFSAKVAGRRVVTTDSGGPRDFLTETDILVPATGDVPCDPLYRWDRGSTFADYDLDELVSAMQDARGCAVSPERISPTFRAEYVGKQLRDWADLIVSVCPPEPAPEPSLVDFGQWVIDGEG